MAVAVTIVRVTETDVATGVGVSATVGTAVGDDGSEPRHESDAARSSVKRIANEMDLIEVLAELFRLLTRLIVTKEPSPYPFLFWKGI